MKTRNQLRQEQSLHFYKRTQDYTTRHRECDVCPIFYTPDTSSPLLTSLLDEPTLCSPSATRAPPKRLPRKIKALHQTPAQYLYEAPRSKMIKTPEYHHSTSFDETPPIKVSSHLLPLTLHQKPHTSPPGSIKQDYRAHNSHRFTRFSGNISESIFNTDRLFRASDAATEEVTEVFPVSPRKSYAQCLSVWEKHDDMGHEKVLKKQKPSIFKKYQGLKY